MRYQSRLQAWKSSVHALQNRLCKWRKSGNRDIVVDRGRPPTKALSPMKRLIVATAIGSSDAHLSSGAVNAVSSSLLGDVDLNTRQQKEDETCFEAK